MLQALIRAQCEMALRRHLNDVRNQNWGLVMTSLEKVVINEVEVGWKARWACYRDSRKHTFVLASIDGVLIGPGRRRNMRRRLRKEGASTQM